MYGKIFEMMYDGSLHEDYKSLIVFQQMIVLADEDGIIDLTAKAMSARTGIPFEYFEYAIPKLESPDNESRTPTEDGRRIIRLDEHRTWGWQIVNYMYYRNMATREDKKKADRERIKRKRADIKANKNTGVVRGRKGSQGVHDVAHTDTDTDKKIYSRILKHLNKKTNKKFKDTTKKTQNFIKARINEGFTEQDFIAVIDNRCDKWLKNPDMIIYLRPETLFGNKFEGYLNDIPAKAKTIWVDEPTEGRKNENN